MKPMPIEMVSFSPETWTMMIQEGKKGL